MAADLSNRSLLLAVVVDLPGEEKNRRSTGNVGGDRDLDTVVFGATGFVGRLSARLVDRAPRGARIGLAGRSRSGSTAPGRNVAIHPGEALLAELRQRQQTPAGRATLRERTKVEHALAHVGHWQGRRARYRGTRKNLFDLRWVAVVHNLHVIARQPTADDYQMAD